MTLGWYRDFDDRQRKAFWACFGGWALDAMDVQIYALVIPTLLAEWSLTRAQAGSLGTVALLASSLGGIIAGYFADRIGRVRVLQITIAWFSVFTFLSGLTQNYEQMFAARTLQGLGFGGEWAAGAVLIAELIPAQNRGRTIAAISSGWSVGYGAAAILFSLLFHVFEPQTAWRVMFFLGIAPAALILFVRRNVSESDLYASERARSAPRAGVMDIFRGRLGGQTAVAWLVCLGVLGGNYTVLTWLPTYLQSERHLSYSNTGLYLLVNIFGSFLGYILGGEFSDRLGRRNSLKLFAILGAASVISYLVFAASPLAILLMGFPLGFAQSAMNAGLGPLLSELYPTRLRATGQGFCYNAGRGVGALFPTLVGLLAATSGLTVAISAAATCAYALVLFCAFLLPETQGRQLSFIDVAGLSQ
jgi:MFS family permease